MDEPLARRCGASYVAQEGARGGQKRVVRLPRLMAGKATCYGTCSNRRRQRARSGTVAAAAAQVRGGSLAVGVWNQGQVPDTADVGGPSPAAGTCVLRIRCFRATLSQLLAHKTYRVP